MSLYWCPCIVVGGLRYYLPPWIDVRDRWSQSVDVLSPPYDNRARIADIYDSNPVSISLECTGIPTAGANARNVLDWMASIRAQLRGRTFSLYLFNDRGYEVCALSNNDQRIPLEPLKHISTSIDIVSETVMSAALPTLEFPGGYNNDYPYASVVGRPSGGANNTGGIAVIQPPYQTQNGTFAGVITQPTAVGNEHRFTVGGAPNSQWLLESLQITSVDASVPATGSTTVAASIGDANDGAPSVSASIGIGQYFSAESTAAINVTAGSTIHVFVTNAGEHSNLQYAFKLKGI